MMSEAPAILAEGLVKTYGTTTAHSNARLTTHDVEESKKERHTESGRGRGGARPPRQRGGGAGQAGRAPRGRGGAARRPAGRRGIRTARPSGNRLLRNSNNMT